MPARRKIKKKFPDNIENTFKMSMEAFKTQQVASFGNAAKEETETGQAGEVPTAQVTINESSEQASGPGHEAAERSTADAAENLNTLVDVAQQMEKLSLDKHVQVDGPAEPQAAPVADDIRKWESEPKYNIPVQNTPCHSCPDCEMLVFMSCCNPCGHIMKPCSAHAQAPPLEWQHPFFGTSLPQLPVPPLQPLQMRTTVDASAQTTMSCDGMSDTDPESAHDAVQKGKPPNESNTEPPEDCRYVCSCQDVDTDEEADYEGAACAELVMRAQQREQRRQRCTETPQPSLTPMQRLIQAVREALAKMDEEVAANETCVAERTSQLAILKKAGEQLTLLEERINKRAAMKLRQQMESPRPAHLDPIWQIPEQLKKLETANKAPVVVTPDQVMTMKKMMLLRNLKFDGNFAQHAAADENFVKLAERQLKTAEQEQAIRAHHIEQLRKMREMNKITVPQSARAELLQSARLVQDLKEVELTYKVISDVTSIGGLHADSEQMDALLMLNAQQMENCVALKQRTLEKLGMPERHLLSAKRIAAFYAFKKQANVGQMGGRLSTAAEMRTIQANLARKQETLRDYMAHAHNALRVQHMHKVCLVQKELEYINDPSCKYSTQEGQLIRGDLLDQLREIRDQVRTVKQAAFDDAEPKPKHLQEQAANAAAAPFIRPILYWQMERQATLGMQAQRPATAPRQVPLMRDTTTQQKSKLNPATIPPEILMPAPKPPQPLPRTTLSSMGPPKLPIRADLPTMSCTLSKEQPKLTKKTLKTILSTGSVSKLRLPTQKVSKKKLPTQHTLLTPQSEKPAVPAAATIVHICDKQQMPAEFVAAVQNATKKTLKRKN